MARLLDTQCVVDVVANLIRQACYELDDNLVDALRRARETEPSPYGRQTLEILIENARYAREEQLPCCHDTGTCILWVKVGQEIAWTGAPLAEMLQKGVAKGYEEAYLRKSMVRDPVFDRTNTGDNTPAVIHYEIIPGDKVHIAVLPKGGGSENMSTFCTLMPADGPEGVKRFVVETMQSAGGKPCPPVILGIGIGGTMDWCTWISKQALLRPIGARNENPLYAKLEQDILKAVNDLGIGPMGMGGATTCLDVHIEYHPCHITSLPVAITFQCHASRHAFGTI